VLLSSHATSISLDQDAHLSTITCALSLSLMAKDVATSRLAQLRRGSVAWAKVNGGVLLCAALSHAASRLAAAASGPVAAAAVATGTLYAVVYAAAAINLRGRRRTTRPSGRVAPIALMSIVWHPLGSCLERLVHQWHLAAPPAGATDLSAAWPPPLLSMLAAGGGWWLAIALRCASRAAPAVPHVASFLNLHCASLSGREE
jgi:hypothetical protein